MARTCTICSHPNREEIDADLLGSTGPIRTESLSLRQIAAKWAVSKTALVRHRADHIPVSLARAAEAAQVVKADTLLGRLKTLNAETQAILREARSEPKDNPLALKAIARVERQLELEARLLGELTEGATITLATSPDWLATRSAILRAIDPYPEARRAVLEALNGLSA